MPGCKSNTCRDSECIRAGQWHDSYEGEYQQTVSLHVLVTWLVLFVKTAKCGCLIYHSSKYPVNWPWS